LLLSLILVAGMFTMAPGAFVEEPATRAAAGGLRVQGNQLVDGSGNVVRLFGVNRSGTEYAAIQGWGFHASDFPSDVRTVRHIASWHANAIRVPLNEHSWLALNGAPAAYSGPAYQAAIREWVDTITGEGLYAVLELHWTGAGMTLATGQQPMPNRDHSIDFWREVATEYKDHSLVIFDLFNEPYPDNNQDTAEAWRCLRDGGTCRGMSFQVAGMQELVDTVRGTGASNLILVGGLQYSNTLTRWLEYAPHDPAGNLAAKWHSYDFNWHVTPDAWDRTVAPVAREVPLVATEVGGSTTYMTTLLNWLDQREASYLAWTWNIWGSAHDLIVDADGTPSAPYGEMFKSHLAEVAWSSPPSPPADDDATPLTVIATPAGGTFTGPISVTLAASGPATIYFTTDGSAPTQASAVFNGEISVEVSMTITFVAVDDAGNQSDVMAESYTIETPDDVSDEPPDGVDRVEAPTNLTASHAGGRGRNQRINLHWSHSDGNAAKFIVERSTNASFTAGLVSWELPADGMSYSDFDVASRTTYYYRVSAVTMTGVQSEPSNTVSASTR
jgi:endoglucanase